MYIQSYRELNGTYSRLKHEVDVAKSELRADIELKNKDINRLDADSAKAKILR